MELKLNQKVMVSDRLYGTIISFDNKYVKVKVNRQILKFLKSNITPYKVKVHISEIANKFNCSVNQVEII